MNRLFHLLICSLTLLGITFVQAVEKEETVDETIQSLAQELSTHVKELPANMASFDNARSGYMKKRALLKTETAEMAVILHSQSFTNLFSLAYYCQQVASISSEFKGNQFPFTRVKSLITSERDRYIQLKQSLEHIDPTSLNPTGKKARKTALQCCDELSESAQASYDQLLADEALFQKLGEEIDQLNDYANGKAISTEEKSSPEEKKEEGKEGSTSTTNPLSIIPALQSKGETSASEDKQTEENAPQSVSGRSSSPSAPHEEPAKLVQSNTQEVPGLLVQMMTQAFWTPNRACQQLVSGLFSPDKSVLWSRAFDFGNSIKKSEMNKLGIRFLEFASGSFLLSFLLFFVMLKKRLEQRNASSKRLCYTLSGTFFFLSLCLFANCVTEDLVYMKTAGMMAGEFFFIVAAIFLSLSIRLSSEKIGRVFWTYVPMIILCACFVTARMIMVSNITINCLLPLLLALVAIANGLLLAFQGKELPLLDRALLILSFIVTLTGACVSFYGYSFLTFLGTLIWIILMSSIQFISSIQVLMSQFQSKILTKKKSESSSAWFQILVSKLMLPLTGIVLLVYSFLWPASIFDMSRMIWEWAGKTYAVHDIVKSVSIKHLLLIVIAGIVLNYLIHLGKHVLREIYKENYDVGGVPTIVTLSSFVLWGIYLFIALAILEADYQGILMIMGGMSMGIGFALKDTIDNLTCGLSLMLGRLRPGDVVECDGIRGKVSSIGYRTTYIETTDGSIIAFQNNQLFNKNFRNFTKNHLYECVKVVVGISYGTDIDQARQIILSATRKVETLAKNKNTLVVLDNFGDNSVDLGVWVWVPVRTKAANLSRVREAIYQAFNSNGIEIPFPQRDIYIKSMPKVSPALPADTSSTNSNPIQTNDNPSHE